MNALAHMCIGFGASLGANTLQLVDYEDADQGAHPNISKMPFIILKAKNSHKIAELRQAAIDQEMAYADFTDTMTVGTYQEQLDRTKTTAADDLEYFGIVLLGPFEQVAELTKKFSLYH